MPRQVTFLSLLASIGSILIALLLVHQNRTKQDLPPTEAVSELAALNTRVDMTIM